LPSYQQIRVFFFFNQLLSKRDALNVATTVTGANRVDEIQNFFVILRVESSQFHGDRRREWVLDLMRDIAAIVCYINAVYERNMHVSPTSDRLWGVRQSGSDRQDSFLRAFLFTPSRRMPQKLTRFAMVEPEI